MQYAPIHTGQKFDSTLYDESQTRYVLGRIRYATTYRDQKFDSYLLDESETWKVFGCISLRPTSPQWETIKICMGTRETRQGLDGYDQYYTNLGEQLLKIVWMHPKPAKDWTNMAIFTENSPRIARIWPFSPKTRREWDKYGHIRRKPGEDWTNIAIFTENPTRIGLIWTHLSKTRREWGKYGHSYRKLGGNRVNMDTAIENSSRMG